MKIYSIKYLSRLLNFTLFFHDLKKSKIKQVDTVYN